MKRFIINMILGFTMVGGLCAQTSINWSTVSGGGGASGSGGILLNGSFGVFAGGPASSATVQQYPGFWSGVSAPLFSALPFLKIELSDGSKVQLSWPVTATGFNLQQATVLTPPDWQDYNGRPTQGNGLNIVAEEAVGTKFYRLTKP